MLSSMIEICMKYHLVSGVGSTHALITQNFPSSSSCEIAGDYVKK